MVYSPEFEDQIANDQLLHVHSLHMHENDMKQNPFGTCCGINEVQVAIFF